jgi:hypothetical protein
LIGLFGMPACGWLAVVQIQRSSGMLYGRVLALFDGLFFPMLAVDFLIGVVIAYIVMAIMPNSGANRAVQALVLLVWLLVVIPLDFFIFRKAWRLCWREDRP